MKFNEMLMLIIERSVDAALGEMARQSGAAHPQLALEARGAGLSGGAHFRDRLIESVAALARVAARASHTAPCLNDRIACGYSCVCGLDNDRKAAGL
jgi:hypothetical protein